MTMQAGFEALTSEAEEWDTTCEALKTARAKVDGLYLHENNFSFITFVTGVASSYETARQHVIDVLDAGAGETKEIGAALRGVRDDFESTDQSRRDAAAALWEPEG